MVLAWLKICTSVRIVTQRPRGCAVWILDVGRSAVVTKPGDAEIRAGGLQRVQSAYEGGGATTQSDVLPGLCRIPALTASIRLRDYG
jgi:hypothetical protein